MTSEVPCKLRIVPPSTTVAPAQPMNEVTLDVKEEPGLASGTAPTRSTLATSNLVFQPLNFTNISPCPKEEPSVRKAEPSLVKNEPRHSKHELIVLDSDDDSVTYPAVQVSRETFVADTQSEDSDTVKRPRRRNTKPSKPKNGISDRGEAFEQTAAPLEREDHMKTSLEAFLRYISTTAQGEGSCSSLLNDAERSFRRAEQRQENTIPQCSHPTRPSQRHNRRERTRATSSLSDAEIRKDTKIRKDARSYILPKRAEVKPKNPSVEISQGGGSSAVRGENIKDLDQQPVFAFGTDIRHESSRHSPRAHREKETHCHRQFPRETGSLLESGKRGDLYMHTRFPSTTDERCDGDEITPANDTLDGMPNIIDRRQTEIGAQHSVPPAKLGTRHTAMRDSRHDEERYMLSCRPNIMAKEEPTLSNIKQDERTSYPFRRNSLPLSASDKDKYQATPPTIPATRTVIHDNPHSDNDSPARLRPVHAEEQRRQEIWCNKYYRLDMERNTNGKRRRVGKETSRGGGNGDIDSGDMTSARISQGGEEESDADPDELELSPRSCFKRTSQRYAGLDKDRDKRAQRRAAEAAGNDVHWSLMVDRKPAKKELCENVTIKVRETRGKIIYTFVKPREVTFRDLREELELVAELPRAFKFELIYKKGILKDSDTPQSIGIQHTARLRARRRIKEDDSSDSVTEVERKRRRDALLKVTVQDEKGKKHEFQHYKKSKFSSMFEAFARLCDNDVRSYRFFYDGRRLSHDDRPVDCEDFEDGSVIDAFFEAQGGAALYQLACKDSSVLRSLHFTGTCYKC